MLHTRKEGVSLPVAVMGTIAVQIPNFTTPTYSTIVVMPGVTTDDALIVFPNKGASAAYNFGASTTNYIAIAAHPSDGSAIIHFSNVGNATGYVDRIWSYVAAR